MENYNILTHERLKKYRQQRDEMILNLVEQDMTYDKIAKIYDISRQRVHQIVVQQRALAALQVSLTESTTGAPTSQPEMSGWKLELK